MASIFSKIRTLTLGNLHELLDAAIDLNSIPAIKQSIRDMEDGKKQIERQAAIAIGRRATVQGTVDSIQFKITSDTNTASTLLNDEHLENDSVGEELLERVADLEPELEAAKQELAEADKLANGLRSAVEKIGAKHAQMLKRLREVETLERTATAKEQTTAALEQAGAIGGSVDSASVDNVERRLRERASTADAAFDQALGGLNSNTSLDDRVAATMRKSRAQELAAQLKKK